MPAMEVIAEHRQGVSFRVIFKGFAQISIGTVSENSKNVVGLCKLKSDRWHLVIILY